MQIIDSTFSDALLASCRQIVCKVQNETITLTKDDISRLEIEWNCGESDSYSIGTANSVMATITIRKTANSPSIIKGSFIPQLGCIVDGKEEFVQQGIFYPDKTSIVEDDGQFVFNAYDKMYDLSGVIFNNNTCKTIGDVITVLHEDHGLNIQDTTQYNDIAVDVSDFYGKPVRNVIADIALILGCNAIFNRFEVLTFIKPSSVELKLTSDNYYTYKSMGESKLTKLTNTITVDEEGTEQSFSEGDDTGTEIISSLATLNSLQGVKDLYTRASFPIEYEGYELRAQGIPHIDLCDIAELTDVKGNKKNILVIYHKLTYHGGLTSEIKASVPEKEVEKGSQDFGSAIVQIKHQVQHANGQIAKTESQILEILEDIGLIQGEVETATGVAGTAQATADSKNKVFYAGSGPVNNDSNALKLNDLWFNTAENNCSYRWNGTSWERKAYGNAAIDNLDAGKITTGFLSADRIASNTVMAKIAEFGGVSADYMNVNELASLNATIGGFSIVSGYGISQESNDGLNKVLFRPVQTNKSFGVFHVMERTSKTAAWEYPVSINGDGSAKFTKLTVGGNSMLAGWRVTDDIIRKEIEIGGIKYQTCLQAADSVNTTNNIYVRHSSDGVGWDYDFSLNYLGKLTTNNINVTGGNINIAAKNIGQSYVSVYLKDATHDMKASLLPFCLSVIDSKEKFSTQLDSAGIDFKRSDGIKGQIKLDYDNLLRVSGITKFVDSIRFDNASGIQVKDTSGTYRRMLTIDADNGMRIASNGCTGALYIGNMSNSDTYLYGRQMLFNTRSTSGEDGTRIRLFREPNTGEGRTIFRPDVPNGAYQGSASYRWNTVFCGTLNQTSDLKLKNVIGEIAKAKEFIMGLKPIEYTFKQPDSSNPRTHMGFGAQPVKELVESIGMGDRALYQASVINEDGSESYYDETVDDSKLSWGLNYNEFIAPLVKVVQDQQKEIENLKEAIRKIEAA